MNELKKRIGSALEYLYFGSEPKDARSADHKRATLLGHLSLIGIVVSIFYILLELQIGNIWFIPYYGIILAASLGGLICLRIKLFNTAKFVFIMPIILLVALFTTVESHETGLYLYFIVSCLAAFTVFSYEQRYYAFYISIFIILVFSISFFSDIELIDSLEMTDEYKRSSFIANFFISILISILLIYYLMRINWMSEQDMTLSAIQLTESRKRFELAIRGSSAGIWDWNALEKTMFLSPRIVKMLKMEGEGPQTVSADWTFDILHPEDRDRFVQTLNEHIFHGKLFALECRFKASNGDYIWVYDTGQAEWDNKGRILRMVGTVLDITERKEAEKQLNEQRDMLQKTNSELDRFVYSTSHDLRAPLSSILGLINIAQFSDDPQELKHFLTMIKERVDALNVFIDEIIEYSRNSRLEVKHENVALFDFMVEILSSFKYYENYDAITIKNLIPKDMIITADIARLKVICNNLITNAIKYHNVDQEEPHIILQAHNNGALTKLEISDNGYGIDDELQPYVFDMFFRASELSKGSGLGLYIVREMVEKIGGSINLSSTKGVGTKFILNLPII